MSDFNENQNNEQVTPDAEPVITEQPSFAEAQLVDGVEPAKKKPVLLIVAIIVVILAAGSVLAYNFIPWVKNNVKMLISKPEDYYAWVEEENISELADCISEGYGKGLDSIGKQAAEEVEVKAELDSANVGALIEEISGSPLSESGITIPSDIAIKAGAKNDGENVSESCLITAGDKTLATLNYYVQDGAYYAQIPELSPAYISIDLNSIMEEAYAEMDSEAAAFFQGYMDAVTSLSKDPSALKDMLSEEELNELIVKYFTMVFENIDDVELEKGVSCEANGIKTKYNKLVAEVDEGALYSICKDVLKEAKKDKTIIKLVEKFGLSKDDYTSGIDSLLEELGSYEVSGGETLFTMNVYVDSKGVICGREIAEPDTDDVLGYMTAEDGSDKALDINFAVDDEGFKISGKSTEKSGKESGEVKIVVLGVNDDGSNVEIPVSFKDVETVNEDKGYCKGEFTLDLTAFEGPSLTFVMDSDGKGQTIKSDITVDGTNYGTISITSKEETTIDIPAFDSSQKVYKYTEDGAEMEQYITDATDNLAAFIDNIGSAFGVEGLGSIFSGAIADSTGGNALGGDITGGNALGGDIIGGDITGGDVDIDITDDPMSGANAESGETTYDLSKMSFQINGQNVTFPAKINGILDLVKVDDAQIDAYGFESYFSEDYLFGVFISNESDKPVAPADCLVTGFTLSEGSAVAATVDGFTIGSNAADVAAKYGAVLSDPSTGSITVSDTTSTWNYITFYYYNGKINSIYFDIIEY